MALYKRECLCKNFFTIMIFHQKMVRAVKSDNMFLFGADKMIDGIAIACWYHMVIARSHNQCRGSDAGQFLAQSWQVKEHTLQRSHRCPAVDIACVASACRAIAYVFSYRREHGGNAFDQAHKGEHVWMHI